MKRPELLGCDRCELVLLKPMSMLGKSCGLMRFISLEGLYELGPFMLRVFISATMLLKLDESFLLLLSERFSESRSASGRPESLDKVFVALWS